MLKDDVYLSTTSSSLKICICGCHNDNLDVLRVIFISLANFFSRNVSPEMYIFVMFVLINKKGHAFRELLKICHRKNN